MFYMYLVGSLQLDFVVRVIPLYIKLGMLWRTFLEFVIAYLSLLICIIVYIYAYPWENGIVFIIIKLMLLLYIAIELMIVKRGEIIIKMLLCTALIKHVNWIKISKLIVNKKAARTAA